jgi:dephospho-CoA kinase
LIVGVTGGIGSGKSRVASLLGRLLGGIVISADEVCRELLEAGREGYLQFVRSGGTQFLDGDGVINRVKLREKIFADPALRDQLEAILHPLVLERIQALAKDAPDSFVIAEVPLLFERGWQDQFDTIIAVSSPEDVVVQRVVDRDRISREDVGKIIAVQMSMEEKSSRADHVIDNSADWQESEKQVVDLAARLKKIKSG